MQGVLADPRTDVLGVAKLLAAELETSPRPATLILQDRIGRELRTDILPGHGTRPLTDCERHRLAVPGPARCCYRTGWLRYGVHGIAAAVTLAWLPARLPCDACVQLGHTNRPAGLILQPYGVQRADRRALVITGHDAELDPGDGGLEIAVRSSAVLVVLGWPAAIATERVTRAFLEDHC